MGRFADLLGTVLSAFKIGRATVSASGLTANRTATLPDKTGTLAMLDDVPPLSNTTPQPLGTATAGTATSAARADHIHAMPTAAQVGAEPAFAKGDLVAGSGVSLSGTLAGRLVGSGSVTITASGGGSGTPDYVLHAFGVI